MSFPKGLGTAALLLICLCSSAATIAQPDKSNVLVVWGDDVGMWNISAYRRQ